jgi:type II secretory ATPase GspE/PulE/Tfp pilus assembly ATPase PilB-like protein
MTEHIPLNPAESFRRALKQAFPTRAEIATLRLEGSPLQQWQCATQVLGLPADELARRLAPVLALPLATDLYASAPEALALVPHNFCQLNTVLPLRLEGDTLWIASADPFNDNLLQRMRFFADRKIALALAAPDMIDDAIVVVFSREGTRAAQAEGLQGRGGAPDEHAIPRLARTLFQDALTQRASDLHIQPFLGAAAVRIRVDGLLRRLSMLPDAVASMLIRHIKAVSGMEPTNVQMPQDGRMSMEVEGRALDMRVSTLPATGGERLVIRFLDQSRVHRLSGAGFSLAALQTLRRAASQPSGMVLVSGPTGSGKTSTLYAMLSEINRSTVNIITVENPVEYRIGGISQVEVNDKAGRGFAQALRSILRQDPDVVLIGEIRDQETAEIAASAALTGHLVLSTLHTNDALTAIPRLLNLGVDPTILADSLAVIVAQRLCRVLCPHCKAPATEALGPEDRLFFEITRNRPGHRAVGCAACNFTGFHGRLPIVDIVEMNPALRAAIACGESRLEVLEGLRQGGLKSLAASGAQRIISGDTTMREVVETVGSSFWSELAEHYGTTLANGTGLEAAPRASQGQGVLLLGDNPVLAQALQAALEEDGMRLVVATTAPEAGACLQGDEDLVFILGDVPEAWTLEQTQAQLQQNRLHIAWSRLPTVVLIPAALADQKEALRQGGVLGPMLVKPVDALELRALIRRARAR